MSKKRPRGGPSPFSGGRPAGSKLEPEYWLKRLFKCRYTYKGKQLEVRNWSVKIQHGGIRKTFPLRSGRRSEAAIEACELYRALVTKDGRDAALQGGRRPVQANPVKGGQALPAAEKFGADYWAQRLIHREYMMNNHGPGRPELSVRMEHGGTGHYFPLGTNDDRLAAKEASRIYQTILRYGWATANERFSRELTVAFRWLDNPLAWTYTTIHTQNRASLNQPVEPSKEAAASLGVVVAESDAGIRRALEWCINHMEGLRCRATFTSAKEVLQHLRQEPVQLVLVSHDLADKSGTACLEELKVAAPAVAGLLYSVYEDSEELFKTTPGGAGIYLLRRTSPIQFLEPIAGWLKQGPRLAEQMVPAAWQYFKDSITSMPIGGATHHLTNLTQREHDVLGLLSKGHPDKDIADQLGISIHTVHEHVRNIFEKLGVHNRTEAVVKFLQK